MKHEDYAPDETTIELRKPIKVGEDVVSSITLREPTAYEIEQVHKKAEVSAQGSNILLLSLTSGQPVPVIQRMAARDFFEALKFVQGFLPAGPGMVAG